MKKRILYFQYRIACTSIYRMQWLIVLIFSGWFLATAQEGETESTSEEAPEKEFIKSRVALTVNQYPDATLELNGLLRARLEGSYQKVPGETIAFYSLDAEGNEKPLGETKTAANGIAVTKVKAADLVKDVEGYLSFIARYEGTDEISGSEGDLHIRQAKLGLTPVSSDSSYAISVTATAISGDSVSPIADATVSVYVQRMFSKLKVGEGSTDESGNVEIEFPNDLSGDQDANMAITALIEETEEYGNLIAETTQKWGYAVSKEFVQAPRALWSPHPPLWMMITFFILMTAVWGHYIVIIYQLLRIKREGNASRENV